MASNGTLKALVALSTAGATSGLIRHFVSQEKSGRKSRVLKSLKQIDRSVKKARDLWPNLNSREIEQYTKIAKPLHDRIFSGPGFQAHTLTWLSRILLEHVQGELWDRGSLKGGAIDDVLRHMEDLHWEIGSPNEEACRIEAQKIFEMWKGSLVAMDAQVVWRVA